VQVAKDGLAALTAGEAAARIAAGSLSSEAYVGACLEHIAAVEPTVHAFVNFDPGHALAQAQALDRQRQDGAALGPLHGVPVAIKDNFDTAEFPTECGSPLLKGRRPVRDSAVVERLRAGGAVIIGKTVTTEFAYYNPGPTRNPHDPSRTPGGSSSGSAAAVAAGMVPLAIGSQTNGSVIRPASFCGVYGVKPSHGAISRARCLPLSRHLDHVGVFSRSLADAGLLLDVLVGYDADDPDTRLSAGQRFHDTMFAQPPTPPRIAFVRTPAWSRAEPYTQTAFENLATQFATNVEPLDLPDSFAAGWDDQRVIMATDMAHNFGALVARNPEGASPMLRDLLTEGANTTAVRYLAAVDNAGRYKTALARVFKEFDAILTPSAPGVAPPADSTGNPAFCTFWSLTGLPEVTLPLLRGEGGLPLGVQLVGAAGDDARLLRTANWLVSRMAG
jgi:Asp-tRNA(Asn)/Glu-tRNA(Gln) amidotransferase A subunit family amidase